VLFDPVNTVWDVRLMVSDSRAAQFGVVAQETVGGIVLLRLENTV
jgi:hypothetical protein